MDNAEQLFSSTMDWLKRNYTNYTFFLERDLVWTVQTRLLKEIKDLTLPFSVHNDYPMLPTPRRSLSTDIAVLNHDGAVDVAVEFKYEPSHKRTDINKGKFPVVMWNEVLKDVARVREFVQKGKSRKAYAILIDEGGYFSKRESTATSNWVMWGNGVSVLWTEV